MTNPNKQLAQTGAESTDVAQTANRRPVVAPDVDILENGDGILLFADVPGVDENEIDIQVENRVLTIRARSGANEPSHHRLVAGGYVPADFERVFTLSDEIEQDKIQASVKNGVLRLLLPKAGKAKARKINVTVE